MSTSLDQSLLTLESSLSPAAAADAILAAAPEHKFGVLGDIDIHATLNGKGFPFPNAVRVIEICSPSHANTVLGTLLEVSTALPCRISVFERDGKTYVSTMKPTVMLEMFQIPELAEVAKEIEVAMESIMRAAL
jgi:uncharacterized protein (DUF302 family)